MQQYLKRLQDILKLSFKNRLQKQHAKLNAQFNTQEHCVVIQVPNQRAPPASPVVAQRALPGA
jgi:hypothetical protein